MAKENSTQWSQATPDEVEAIAHGISKSTRPEVARIACLIHLHRSMTQRYERETGTSLAPITHLQAECEMSWMTQQGINTQEVKDAVARLGRAQDTLNYLDSLPA